LGAFFILDGRYLKPGSATGQLAGGSALETATTSKPCDHSVFGTLYQAPPGMRAVYPLAYNAPDFNAETPR